MNFIRLNPKRLHVTTVFVKNKTVSKTANKSRKNTHTICECIKQGTQKRRFCV